MSESKTPWLAVLAVLVGLALLLLFFAMQGKIFEAIKAPGRAIINALNGMLAGRPPWLK
jgi:sensor histidine kinase YesM